LPNLHIYGADTVVCSDYNNLKWSLFLSIVRIRERIFDKPLKFRHPSNTCHFERPAYFWVLSGVSHVVAKLAITERTERFKENTSSWLKTVLRIN
jgi:hypothetical protein